MNVVWKPYPGSSQVTFLSCPIFECLFEGTRGGCGKTDALIVDFLQFCGKGFGPEWQGVLFREEYKQLEDVVKKTKKLIPRVFPGAKFLSSKADYRWIFPEGEELAFRTGSSEDDYWDYHGHAYPWIGFEELTNWPVLDFYLAMATCCRSTCPGIPRHFRATANPYGVGHHWVKERFRLGSFGGRPGDIITEEYHIENEVITRKRTFVHGDIRENLLLMKEDPSYLANIMAQPEPKRSAWLNGDWNIVAGGMFDDVWDSEVHVIEPFEVPPQWPISRSFDWGSAHPYCCLWFAESDGADVRWPNGDWMPTKKGDLFVIAELYGSRKIGTNKGLKLPASEVAELIVEMERRLNIRGRVDPGPADTQIWNTDGHSATIADDMREKGVIFTKADKSPGSRVTGWEKVRQRLHGAKKEDAGLGIWFFDCCKALIATLPVLPRDGRNMDDVDTETEDHAADALRYRVAERRSAVVSKPVIGVA